MDAWYKYQREGMRFWAIDGPSSRITHFYDIEKYHILIIILLLIHHERCCWSLGYLSIRIDED